MIKHRLAVALLAPVFAFATIAPALALDPPPTDPNTCAGLFCTLGIIGGANDPRSLPCNDFICGAFGKRRAQAPAPEPIEQAPEPKPAKKHARAHAKSAKAASPTPVTASRRRRQAGGGQIRRRQAGGGEVGRRQRQASRGGRRGRVAPARRNDAGTPPLASRVE